MSSHSIVTSWKVVAGVSQMLTLACFMFVKCWQRVDQAFIIWYDTDESLREQNIEFDGLLFWFDFDFGVADYIWIISTLLL